MASARRAGRRATSRPRATRDRAAARRRSTGTTATTSATTRRPRCGAGSGGASHAEGLTTISGLQERVLHDPACMERLLLDLSVNVTAMFRDPTFYRAFREQVVPLLRTYPFIRIWHAGCSTGEEVYSLAILLQEEGLYDRAASTPPTSTRRCSTARAAGHLPARADAASTRENYLARRRHAVVLATTTPRRTTARSFARSLRENIVFAQHNLVTDRSFNEFHVDPLPQRADLLRPRAAGPRARPVLREPGDVRRPRARPQGVAAVHAVRASATRSSTRREKLYRKVR